MCVLGYIPSCTTKKINRIWDITHDHYKLIISTFTYYCVYNERHLAFVCLLQRSHDLGRLSSVAHFSQQLTGCNQDARGIFYEQWME